MIYLRTDQYTHVNPDCPMRVDLYPADDVVEIALGEHRIGGDTLRLVVGHPDAFSRLVEALRDGRERLLEHLRVKGRANPAMSELGSASTVY